jgi:ribonuclease HII
MPLLLAGIDEAGYGPRLGPLCVGFTLLRVRDWKPGDDAPCLWKLLKAAVCRKASDARKRIPIADSKQLKLANDNKARHPLVHLERGVLAFLRAQGRAPDTDDSLFADLKARLESQPWYAGSPVPIPVGQSSAEIAIAAGRIAAALESAGVEILDIRCQAVGESAVNLAIKEHGSKAEATAGAIGEHLRRLFMRPLAEGEHLRIVCDQLGGRTQYESLLAREIPGTQVTPLAEDNLRSRYKLELPSSIPQSAIRNPQSPPAIIQFMPEAESAHLPVALASMVAKLVRELSMMRFNRYWCSRCPELKPTAGYYADAGRWLRDAARVLTGEERAAIVRTF